MGYILTIVRVRKCRVFLLYLIENVLSVTNWFLIVISTATVV